MYFLPTMYRPSPTFGWLGVKCTKTKLSLRTVSSRRIGVVSGLGIPTGDPTVVVYALPVHGDGEPDGVSAIIYIQMLRNLTQINRSV